MTSFAERLMLRATEATSIVRPIRAPLFHDHRDPFDRESVEASDSAKTSRLSDHIPDSIPERHAPDSIPERRVPDSIPERIVTPALSPEVARFRVASDSLTNDSEIVTPHRLEHVSPTGRHNDQPTPQPPAGQGFHTPDPPSLNRNTQSTFPQAASREQDIDSRLRKQAGPKETSPRHVEERDDARSARPTATLPSAARLKETVASVTHPSSVVSARVAEPARQAKAVDPTGRPTYAPIPEPRKVKDRRGNTEVPALPPIKVTIGRVEVRAVVESPPAPKKPRVSASPPMSLSTYLEQRRRGAR